MSFRDRIDPGWQDDLPRHPLQFVWRENKNLDESLPIVDRLLEPQTFVHFLEFSMRGVLPTGEEAKSNLITYEVFTNYFMVPYAQWAPGPHDQFGDSPNEHVQIRIGSFLDSDRLVIVEKRVHAMKSRLWEGIMPMSETRWRQKGLDAIENRHLAYRYIAQVIEVFSYLQYQPIQDALAETYSLIYGHLRDFDRAINRLPEREGAVEVQLAPLWEEYMTAHFTAMTTRAHNWVISKVNHLRDLEDQRLAALDLSSSTQEYATEHLAISNRIHTISTLALNADISIFIGMPKSDPPASKIMPMLEERGAQWQKALSVRTNELMLEDMLRDVSLNRTPEPVGSPSSSLKTVRIQRQAHDELRVEWRGNPVELPPVGWIQRLKEFLGREGNTRWGFTAYRLSYKASDTEWADFLQKLEADLNNWGEGEPGAEGIKPLSKLVWFDGKELGLPEDDIDAAVKHFKEKGQEANTDDFGDNIFLAIDTPSYDSYTYGPPFADILLPGDTGGFVTAVDSHWRPLLPGDDPDDRADESPNYAGRLRILGNLVYPDLYAMLNAQNQYTDDLWPLAMNHPELIYAGTTIEPQVDLWKGVSRMKLSLLDILAKQVCAANDAPAQE